MENVKLIIVEDQENLRELFIDSFEFFLNRKVQGFSSADAALSYLENNEVNFVISDVDMPGQINGLGLLETVKKRWPDIIFISMSGNPQYLAPAETLGADAFLVKPFGLNDLIKIVEEFIAR